MGIAEQPSKAKLFLALLYRPDADIDGIMGEITNVFGRFDHTYGPIQFAFSDYYKDEVGEHPLKWYMTFERFIERDRLPSIKNITNAIEAQFLDNGIRTANLDPGYLVKDKLVLATTKDFYHRLYLAEGIFGEVTLHFRKGVFRYFSWTYPDYMDSAFLEFLMKVRAEFVHEIK
jgi:hypothetical protein